MTSQYLMYLTMLNLWKCLATCEEGSGLFFTQKSHPKWLGTFIQLLVRKLGQKEANLFVDALKISKRAEAKLAASKCTNWLHPAESTVSFTVVSIKMVIEQVQG